MGVDLRFVNDIGGRDQGVDVIVGVSCDARLVDVSSSCAHLKELGVDFDE